jgi:hypothetical protein
MPAFGWTGQTGHSSFGGIPSPGSAGGAAQGAPQQQNQNSGFLGGGYRNINGRMMATPGAAGSGYPFQNQPNGQLRMPTWQPQGSMDSFGVPSGNTGAANVAANSAQGIGAGALGRNAIQRQIGQQGLVSAPQAGPGQMRPWQPPSMGAASVGGSMAPMGSGAMGAPQGGTAGLGGTSFGGGGPAAPMGGQQTQGAQLGALGNNAQGGQQQPQGGAMAMTGGNAPVQGATQQPGLGAMAANSQQGGQPFNQAYANNYNQANGTNLNSLAAFQGRGPGQGQQDPYISGLTSMARGAQPNNNGGGYQMTNTMGGGGPMGSAPGGVGMFGGYAGAGQQGGPPNNFSALAANSQQGGQGIASMGRMPYNGRSWYGGPAQV